MKLFFFAALFITSSLAEYDCSWIQVSGLAVYDLSHINTQLSLEAQDYFLASKDETDISFNLCQPKVPSCTNPQSFDYMKLQTEDKAKCFDQAPKTFPLEDSYLPFDFKDPLNGIKVTIKTPQKQQEGDIQYDNVTLAIACLPEEIGDIKWTVVGHEHSEFNAMGESYTVQGAHQIGCAKVSIGHFLIFLSQHRPIFMSIFLVLGLYLLFFGFHMQKLTHAIMSLMLGIFVSGIFAFDVVPFYSWLMFLLALLPVGYIVRETYKREMIGHISTGAVVGAITGLNLIQTLSFFFYGKGETTYYLMLAFTTALGGSFLHKQHEKYEKKINCVCGAYLIARAFAAYIGGFSTEIGIAMKIQTFSWGYFGYMLAIVGLNALGWKVQMNMKNEEIKEEDMETGLKLEMQQQSEVYSTISTNDETEELDNPKKK